MTPEISAKLAVYRQKCADGSVTRAELAEAIATLRESRSGAAQAARANPRAKAMGTVPGIDVNAVLAGLGQMVKK